MPALNHSFLDNLSNKKRANHHDTPNDARSAFHPPEIKQAICAAPKSGQSGPTLKQE